VRILAAFLLVAGYGVALPVMFRLRAVFAERKAQWFVVFEVAVALVAAGHLLAGRPIAAAINAVAAVVLAGVWWEIGRRARRDQPATRRVRRPAGQSNPDRQWSKQRSDTDQSPP